MKTILFDGYCNLCSSTVMFIHRRDHAARFSFIPLQSENGKQLLQQNGIPAKEYTSVIYLKDNHHFLRSSAILHILRDIGGGWQLFYGLIIIPPFIRDAVYNLIARLRYRIRGKRTTCMIPPRIKTRKFRDKSLFH